MCRCVMSRLRSALAPAQFDYSPYEGSMYNEFHSQRIIIFSWHFQKRNGVDLFSPEWKFNISAAHASELIIGAWKKSFLYAARAHVIKF